MNGKGDKLRKGANLKAYWENYDRIFRKTISQNTDEDIVDAQQAHDDLNDELDRTSYSEVKI